MLTGDVWCLVTDFASNCVLTIIEDVSGDAQASMLILLSLLHAPQALNQGVMVWGAISFDNRIHLVIIRSTVTTQRHADDILKTLLLPFLL
ncbi:hypothetical protein TNCV_632021 [Trichonephila clavipes]|nr:hypothetical protein TNCV_632021 [Trichonephila clavipes]